MNPQLLTFEDLQSVTGYTRLSDVERCLRKAGIPFRYGRAGIWTTIDAVNAGLGLQKPPGNDGTYDPDSVL